MGDEYEAGYDTAVLPVLAWVSSNDWMETYQTHVGEFYSEMVEAAKVPIFEILAELPTPLWARAVRCCFDDFLTIEYEESPSNALDQYLDEVGMDLVEADVDFLVAFRNSVVRAYYVVGRTPYESVELRDLSGGVRAIQIDDEMLTATLCAGDNIATRIVTMKDKDYLAGPVLVLDDETLEAFKQGFEAAFKEEMRTVEKFLRKDPRVQSAVRKRVLRGSAPVVSGMWVAKLLAAMLDWPPLAGEDDVETVFQATLPVLSSLEPIVECLEAHPDLDRPFPREFLWLWHVDRADPGASLKGMVWLLGEDLCIESCERSRVEEAAVILADLLGDAIGEATIEELGDDLDDEDDDGWLLPAPETDEEVSAFRTRLHEFLDIQFRSILDSPVPELKDLVPRELAKTAKGRKQLIKWLTLLEARLGASMDPVGLADYDLRWMWQELGIDEHRQSSLFE